MESREVEATFIISHEVSGKTVNESYYIMRDLFAGTISGFANLVSGHPFDTIKVRMQMSGLSLSACVGASVKNEGIFSLYKGIQSPFYTVPLINAVVFGAYGFYHRMMGQDVFSEFSMSQGITAGAFAGLVNCVILSPVELIKCRMQIDYESKFKNATDCMKAIYQYEGIRGLYRGMVSTVLREMPCYAAQFGTYEISKNFLKERYGENMVMLQHLASGGFAGLMCWVFSYPQDVIKTNLQCDNGLDGNRKFKPRFKDGGVIACMNHIWKEKGMMGFWNGFSACAMRAVLANAVGFFAYEQAKSLFKDISQN